MKEAIDEQSSATAGGGTMTVSELAVGYRRGPDVLHDVSFSVGAGEVLAILGRNGAGKTTLLRALSGLLPVRRGRILLGQVDLDRLAPHRIASSGLGHVPEGRRVIHGMTVLDNLRLGAHSARPASAVGERLDEVLDVLPVLVRWKSRVAGTLSGGEQQLLAIGRALMTRPSLLMLDEPLTGLSPAMRRHVLQALSDISATGRSMVIVEQNVVETLPHADRALVLDAGRVVLHGTSDELLRDTAVQEAFLDVKARPRRTSTQPKEA